MSDPTKILSVLRNVRRQSPGSSKEATSWMACCPAHADSTPSLWVKYDRVKDRVIFHCHGGCSVDQVRDALYRKGITPEDIGGRSPTKTENSFRFQPPVFSNTPSLPPLPLEGCTVEQIARVKKLSEQFLKNEFGLTDA